MNIKRFSLVFLSLVLLALPVSLLSSPVSATQQAPGVDRIVSSVSIKLNGIEREDAYDFITNLENDAKWFPGILSTTLITDAGNDLFVGNVYQQEAFVTPELTTNTIITILNARENRTFTLTGDGDFADYFAFYTFTEYGNKNNPNSEWGTVYTLNTVYLAPGFTEETFSFFITNALSGLFNALDTDGSVHINYLRIF